MHTSIPMPQVMKIQDAKAAVDKTWEKLEKMPTWQLDKVKSKRDFILEAHKEKNKVHFASLMVICHLQNEELESKHRKYTGRVVLRGDIVTGDSGAYAVFTEQGSSASKMTAAKAMHVIARLPGCAGQAADAVSAYTRVKTEDVPTLVNIPNSECPDIWIRLPRHKWPKSWSNIEDSVVLLAHRTTSPDARTRTFFSCEHHSASSAHFQCGHTTLAQADMGRASFTLFHIHLVS